MPKEIFYQTKEEAITEAKKSEYSSLILNVHGEGYRIVGIGFEINRQYYHGHLGRKMFFTLECHIEPIVQKQNINLTPTWSSMVPAIVLLLQDGSAEGRKTALQELRNMARTADLYITNLDGQKNAELDYVNENYNMGLLTPQERDEQTKSINEKYK